MLNSKMCCYCCVVGLKFHVKEEKNVIPKRLYKKKSFRDMHVNLQIFELHSQNNIGGLCKRVTELDLYF